MSGFDITPADPLGTLQEYRQQQANTAILESQAAQLQRKQADDQAWRAKIDGLSRIGDTAKQLEQFGVAAISAGRPHEAQQALGLLSTMENRQSLREQREAVAEQRKANADLSQLKFTAEAYAGVTDAFTWETAHEVFKEITGKDSPMKGKPYDPRLVDYVTGALRKKYSDLEEREKESQIAAREARAQTQRAITNIRQQDANTRERNVANKERADGKAGGKAPAPSAPELKAARTVVNEQAADLNEAQKRDLASTLASKAKEIQLAGASGKTFDQLVRQALSENPDLLKKRSTWGGLGPEKREPGAQGLPFPSDLSKIQPDIVYRASDGQLYRWNGKGPKDQKSSYEVVK